MKFFEFSNTVCKYRKTDLSFWGLHKKSRLWQSSDAAAFSPTSTYPSSLVKKNDNPASRDESGANSSPKRIVENPNCMTIRTMIICLIVVALTYAFVLAETLTYQRLFKNKILYQKKRTFPGNHSEAQVPGKGICFLFASFFRNAYFLLSELELASECLDAS
jgi:hypothetical protein